MALQLRSDVGTVEHGDLYVPMDKRCWSALIPIPIVMSKHCRVRSPCLQQRELTD